MVPMELFLQIAGRKSCIRILHCTFQRHSQAHSIRTFIFTGIIIWMCIWSIGRKERHFKSRIISCEIIREPLDIFFKAVMRTGCIYAINKCNCSMHDLRIGIIQLIGHNYTLKLSHFSKYRYTISLWDSASVCSFHIIYCLFLHQLSLWILTMQNVAKLCLQQFGTLSARGCYVVSLEIQKFQNLGKLICKFYFYLFSRLRA